MTSTATATEALEARVTEGGLRVVADAMLDKRCLGYGVQAPLGSAAEESLWTLQQQVQAQVTSLLYLTPPSTLHLSLQAIAPVRAEQGDKEQYFQQAASSVLAELESIGRDSLAFELSFSSIRVTDTAIIALAEEPLDPVRAIRARLAKALPPGPFPLPRYDLVHVTLARFRKGELLSARTVQSLRALKPSAHVRIGELRLVRELVYPSRVLEQVARVSLS